MKKLFTSILLITILISSIIISSCKSKPKDADIKAAIEKSLAADPMSAGTTVSVENGVATITGECKDDMCKTHCADLVSKINGVKSVVNNCTVAPKVEIAADDPLTVAVKDALKDFTSVSATVSDGVIKLSGSIKKDMWLKLKPVLDGLKPKKVDPSGLTIN